MRSLLSSPSWPDIDPSLSFRDPDGNLVNFFTPVTPAAVEKFARR
jgi:hypothetical protein